MFSSRDQFKASDFFRFSRPYFYYELTTLPFFANILLTIIQRIRVSALGLIFRVSSSAPTSFHLKRRNGLPISQDILYRKLLVHASLLHQPGNSPIYLSEPIIQNTKFCVYLQITFYLILFKLL